MNNNRRIGTRHQVDLGDVSWLPVAQRRGLRRPRAKAARLADLSVTGASVIAPPGTEPGRLVRLELAGGFGALVRVQRVAAADADRSRYGVQFIAQDPGFADIVNRTIDAHRPDTDWHWTTAHD
jgi:hypothetical protein